MNHADAPRSVRINEVGPRDGLQMEPKFVPTAQKVALIDALSCCGVARIEVSSFVSARAVPALADAAEVFDRIRRRACVTYAALVPNLRGAEAALDAGADEINFVLSVSETHNLANVRMSPERSLAVFAAVAREVAGQGTRVHASLATSFGCPFEGTQPAERVLDLASRLVDHGAQGVTLADTTGMANPVQVAELAAAAIRRLPDTEITLHFHDTRGMGLGNVLAAWQVGIRSFDASLGGLGGCPFAPGATGNICTVDVAHMFAAMGVETGVELSALQAAAAPLPALVGHELPGRVLKAGPYWRRYSLEPQPG